jgi:hypothetical protein
MASASSPKISCFFRAKQALNYDEATGKGFVTRKSVRETLRIMLRVLRLFFLIDIKLKPAIARLKKTWPAYVTEDFWTRYLHIPPR